MPSDPPVYFSQQQVVPGREPLSPHPLSLSPSRAVTTATGLSSFPPPLTRAFLSTRSRSNLDCHYYTTTAATTATAAAFGCTVHSNIPRSLDTYFSRGVYIPLLVRQLHSFSLSQSLCLSPRRFSLSLSLTQSQLDVSLSRSQTF